ncbi:helix-turn-helix domain-containing protein [Vallicoccus soli]|uniref:Helix-turn-helix domain containing protein n=1 Tax=Vallicoccus soli TaxID=2339232 RepID=A0A3A3YPN9_9ACTN|nr:helix-turn-helix domain-containing protein [Vallicoccus soli]RJK92545.1 helix-turn-helix domain containing protein [Vallicoccus soli]
MAYPSRPVRRALPEFAGTATSRPSPELLERLSKFVVAEYAAGRSLREIAELTDRSFSAVRNVLDRAGVRRRGVGAVIARSDSPQDAV